MNKPFYITENSLTKMLKKQPVSYHHSLDCSILKRGGETVRLTEQEVVDAGAMIQPCKCCVEAAKKDRKPAVRNGAKLISSGAIVQQIYPFPQQITIWTCSDGTEMTKESDALWHELDLTKKRVTKLSKTKK